MSWKMLGVDKKWKDWSKWETFWEKSTTKGVSKDTWLMLLPFIEKHANTIDNYNEDGPSSPSSGALSPSLASLTFNRHVADSDRRLCHGLPQVSSTTSVVLKVNSSSPPVLFQKFCDLY